MRTFKGEHFFVHSMPRRCKDLSNAAEREFACKSLEFFLRLGPLLIPELINIPKIPGNSNTELEFDILQSRFCLTLYEEHSLREHMDLFGPISLVFDSKSVIRSGGVPVFYFPSFEMCETDNALGLSYVHHLRKAIGLIQDLKLLSNLSRSEVSNILEVNITRKEFELLHELGSSLLTKIDHDKKSLDGILGHLQSLSQIFYPANRNRDLEMSSFQYFAQREWRVLSNMRIAGEMTSYPIGDDVRELLLGYDFDFFSAQLHFNGHTFKRLDETELLAPSLTKSFITDLVKVVCFPEIESEVNMVLQHNRLDIKADVI